MPSVRLKPRCSFTDGPPCDRLLDDPEAVLADPDHWPDHFGCPGVQRWSTRQWAEARARRMYGRDVPEPVREWITTWPLPISPPLFAHPPVPTGLYPFPGPEWSMRASFILEPSIPFTEVTAFGIAEAWSWSLLVTIAGQPVDRAMRFCAAADRWWRGDNATGRPTGPRISPEQLFFAALAMYERSGRPPTQDELAAETTVSTRTLRNVLPHGWPAFLDALDARRAHQHENRHMWVELRAKNRTGKKPR